MSAFLELMLDQGTTFTRDLTLTDDITGGNINVVGYTVHCNARASYSSYSRNANVDIVFSTEIVDGPNGAVRISQTAANTIGYYPRRYFYDVLIIDTLEQRTRVLEGILTVTPMVS